MEWLDILQLALLVILLYAVAIWSCGREGFEAGESIMLEDPEKYNDALYASVYKALWHPDKVLDYERVSIQDIALAEKAKTDIKVLDLCCGIGSHACWFKQMGVDYTGVDISPAMLDQARKDCPSANFQKGDVTQAALFPPKSQSHTLLLGFAAYTFPNVKVVSDNAYMWTQPGGVFIVHLVEPDKFDPLLELASPFAAFSVQKYSYDRQMKSEIFFNDFKYTGTFHKKKNEEDASYDEVFTYFNTETSPKNIKYREQKQKLTMPSLESMIDTIKSSGFRMQEKVHLISAGKEYQYLVYFTK
uniref:Methyltransferase domain-containing protein n=1 Tax=viral metagenome TaxID=1070528 RepID=A0A6C0B2Z9_9ZZZZ